jgi:hypothetical protein
VAIWLAGDPPNRASQRNVSEMFRLFEALAEVVPASQIGPWLDTPNPASKVRHPSSGYSIGDFGSVPSLIGGGTL